MYLVINKWVIAVKVSNFSGQYLRNHWTSDIGVLGCIGIVWPKEHSPEVRSFLPGTPCIYLHTYTHTHTHTHIHTHTHTHTKGADKSLAQPGRKQATASKLGIYSTFSPRSPVHFLGGFSNISKPLKKFRNCPFNQISDATMTSASDNKWQSFIF
jgi:hypothetical protein